MIKNIFYANCSLFNLDNHLQVRGLIKGFIMINVRKAFRITIFIGILICMVSPLFIQGLLLSNQFDDASKWNKESIIDENLLDSTQDKGIEDSQSINALVNFIMDDTTPYNWIDATSGSVLSLSDDSYASVPLPFNFEFYDQSFDTLYVSSNGWMSFTNTNPFEIIYGSYPKSDTAYHYSISLYGDDLYPSGDVYAYSDSDKVVIEYLSIDNYGGGEAGTFELVLYKNGDILFQYDYLSTVVSPTVGLNYGPDITYYNNYVGLSSSIDNFAIYFTSYTPDHELSYGLETPNYLERGENVIINATVSNIGLNTEVNVELQLWIDDNLVASQTYPVLNVDDYQTLQYSWTPLSFRTYNVTSYVVPVSNENNVFNIKVTDFVVVVDPNSRIAFITTHGENSMPALRTYYEGVGYYVDDVTSIITENLLSSYALVFAGESGSFWSSAEVAAMENYIIGGGVFVGIGDSNPADGVSQLGASYGITFTGTGTGYTGSSVNINTTHPMMEGVNSVYIPSPFNDLLLSGDAVEIFRDSSDTAIYGASIDIDRGHFAVLADDFYEVIYIADNEIMFANFLNWRSLYDLEADYLFNNKSSYDVIIDVDASENTFLVTANSTNNISALVENLGGYNETNVGINIYANNSLVNNSVIPEISIGEIAEYQCNWTPAVAGFYEMLISIVPHENESYLYNNVTFNVLVLNPAKSIGFIRTHGVQEITNLKSFYSNLNYSTHSLFSDVTDEILNAFQYIFIGEGGGVYSLEEIQAVDNYIANGGICVCIGNSPAHIARELALNHNITYTDTSLGVNLTTTVIDSTHVLLQDVSSVFLPTVFNALQVSDEARAFIWDSTDTGIYGATVDVETGHLCILSDDFAEYLYSDDNEVLFSNILLWKERLLVDIINPDGGERLEGEYLVNWITFNHDDITLNFTLYYWDDVSPGWVLIVENLINDTSYLWNTSKIADGVFYRLMIIVSDGNISAIDYSEDTFIIDNIPEPPTIDILYPNGGEMLNGSVLLTWNATDPDLDILYFTLYYWNGIAWIEIVNSITTMSYLWNTVTIPKGSFYLIRVNVTDGDFNLSDVSDGVFDINQPPELEITYPNDGEIVWGVVTITWTGYDPDGLLLNFTLEYWNGTDWVFIVEVVNENQYEWNVTLFTEWIYYELRITTEDDYWTIVDYTNSTFVIDHPEPPTVSLVTLTGGETIGGDFVIIWNAFDPDYGASLLATLYYWNVSSWIAIATGINESYYLWNTRPILSGSDYLLRINLTDGMFTVTDQSLSPFTIDHVPYVTIQYPNGGEVVSGAFFINWDETEYDGDVLTYTLYYSENSGVNWTYMSTVIGSTSYFWSTISLVDRATYRIRIVVDDGNFTNEDITDADFTVYNPDLPTVNIDTIASPVSGIITITWTASDLDNESLHFTLFYRRGVSSWTSFVYNLIDQTSYQFDTTLYTDGIDYHIRITVTDGYFYVTDESNAFIIDNYEQAPTVALVNPTGGESFSGNVNIRWDGNDLDGDILVYSIYIWDGTSWEEIASELTFESYFWNTETVPNGVYELKVIASDGVFTAEAQTDYPFTVENQTEDLGVGMIGISLLTITALGIVVIFTIKSRRKQR